MKDQTVKNLYGLVLAGGKSKRMNADKAVLAYHGKSQTIFGFELLSKFCEKVFVSTRTDQTPVVELENLPQIHDYPEFDGTGPLGGILSAMHEHPAVSWLILACDLPFVTEATVWELIHHRDANRIATAYKSSHDQLPEPLCAIYEPQARKELLRFFQAGTHCPRKILINSDTNLLEPTDPAALDNVNTPEEYQSALQKLKGNRRS